MDEHARTRLMMSVTIGLLVAGIFTYRFTGNEVGVVERCYSLIMYPWLVFRQHVVQPCVDYSNERKTIQELNAQLQQLKQENAQLRASTIEMSAQLLYAEDIAELIHFKKQFKEESGRIVRVLERQLSEREQYLLVDVGSRHGIISDMVATYKNCLVGKVTEVFPLYSKVVLITDKSCKVAAYCSKTRASGIHVGLQDRYTVLQRVNHLSSVEQGDLVVSSGEGLIFPPGFALGYVDEFKPDGLYQLVAVKPSIEPETLKYCTLIKKGDVTSVKT